jgi:hypothetical protein
MAGGTRDISKLLAKVRKRQPYSMSCTSGRQAGLERYRASWHRGGVVQLVV